MVWSPPLALVSGNENEIYLHSSRALFTHFSSRALLGLSWLFEEWLRLTIRLDWLRLGAPEKSLFWSYLHAIFIDISSSVGGESRDTSSPSSRQLRRGPDYHLFTLNWTSAAKYLAILWMLRNSLAVRVFYFHKFPFFAFFSPLCGLGSSTPRRGLGKIRLSWLPLLQRGAGYILIYVKLCKRFMFPDFSASKFRVS